MATMAAIVPTQRVAASQRLRVQVSRLLVDKWVNLCTSTDLSLTDLLVTFYPKEWVDSPAFGSPRDAALDAKPAMAMDLTRPSLCATIQRLQQL
jgi:hypothetical protein